MIQLVTESGDASLGPDGSRVALCIVEIPKLYIDLDLIHIPDFGRGQDNWQLNHWQYTMFLTDTILDMGRYLQSANHSLINRVLNVTKPINELRTIANRHQPTMKEFIYVMSQMNKVVSRKQQLDDHDDQPKMKKKKSVNLPRRKKSRYNDPRPSSSEYVPSSPIYVPSSPRYEPSSSSPEYVPSSPRYVPSSPRYEPRPPSSPEYDPSSSRYDPSSPRYEPSSSSPEYDPSSPQYEPSSSTQYEPNDDDISSRSSSPCASCFAEEEEDELLYSSDDDKLIGIIQPRQRQPSISDSDSSRW